MSSGFGVRLAVVLMLMVAPCASAQDDTFARQRDEAAAKNPIRYPLLISFGDERRAFHPGEPIPLLFRFYRSMLYHENLACGGIGGGEVIFENRHGASDPLRDAYDTGLYQRVCGVLSGVIAGSAGGGPVSTLREVPVDGRFEIASPPPNLLPSRALEPGAIHSYRAYLNPIARFERPGHYRFYVRSSLSAFHETLVSNILEFDVLPFDPAWAHQAVDDAVSALTGATSGIDAAATLEYLDTDESVAAVVQRYDREPRVYDGSWERALLRARNRRQAIALMEDEVDKTDREMSDRFVRTLALLATAQQSAARPVSKRLYRSMIANYSRRRLAALDRAHVLTAELYLSFIYGAEFDLQIHGFVWAFRDFNRAVEQTLGRFDVDMQARILARRWDVFADPAFVPMLQRLLAAHPNDGRLRDVVLRELYDADQKEGREAILRELADDESVATTFGTGILADPELGQFDDVYVRALERARNEDEYRRAIDRVERYASRNIATRVQRAYERWPQLHDCRSGPVALAYFFRATPEYARAATGEVADAMDHERRCDTGVLEAAAERRMSVALESLAVEWTRGTDARQQVDAARTLARFGSAAAKQELWNAFDQWHERWRGRLREWPASTDHRPTWDEALEGTLAEALEQGGAWRFDASDRDRLTRFCLSYACKQLAARADPKDPLSPSITAYPRTFENREPALFVDGVPCRNRERFEQRIALFPNGTAFQWRTMSAPDAEEKFDITYGAVASLVRAKGMSLERPRARR